MSRFITATLLTTALLASVSSGEPDQTAPTAQTATSLLDVAIGFDGTSSLAKMKELIAAGADINEQDPRGGTPLLYLCYPLEMDYRYNHDPHYAGAVNEAITTLLQNGADVLHENSKGCNAAFYLQSKPELLKELHAANLMPKELAVRIPYETAAFLRYISKRTKQASQTNHEASRQYLIRKYCAPVYERAEHRLKAIITGQQDQRRRTGDIYLLLEFMRLADSERAHKFVHSLNYWEHGEHFLEETPLHFLDTLSLLEWKVDGTYIEKALRKLDSMLPGSPEEMIDCFVAAPMGMLLELYEISVGEKALPTIRKYSTCNEADLAATAYNLLLRRNGQPPIAPQELLQSRSADEQPALDAMSPEERDIYDCAVVDHALRLNEPTELTPELVQKVRRQFSAMQLPRHADIIGQLLTTEGTITTDSYILQAAHHSYIEQPPPSPRMKIAEKMLANPGLFARKPAPQK